MVLNHINSLKSHGFAFIFKNPTYLETAHFSKPEYLTCGPDENVFQASGIW
jgi:hypothetical protein